MSAWTSQDLQGKDLSAFGVFEPAELRRRQIIITC